MSTNYPDNPRILLFYTLRLRHIASGKPTYFLIFSYMLQHVALGQPTYTLNLFLQVTTRRFRATHVLSYFILTRYNTLLPGNPRIFKFYTLRLQHVASG